MQTFRLESKREATRKLAQAPSEFAFVSQPNTDFIAIPSVSSERRQYIPITFFDASVVASNLCLIAPGATHYHFGVLSSAMHMAWVRYVAGRLKSDYRYSSQIVYNNFPWPNLAHVGRDKRASSRAFLAGDAVGGQRRSAPYAGLREGNDDKKVQAVETAARAMIAAREKFPDASLADLYDPAAMPPALRAAHAKLDRAVDAAYHKRSFASEAERVAFLFDQYRQLTTLLPAVPKPNRRKRRPG